MRTPAPGERPTAPVRQRCRPVAAWLIQAIGARGPIARFEAHPPQSARSARSQVSDPALPETASGDTNSPRFGQFRQARPVPAASAVRTLSVCRLRPGWTPACDGRANRVRAAACLHECLQDFIDAGLVPSAEAAKETEHVRVQPQADGEFRLSHIEHKVRRPTRPCRCRQCALLHSGLGGGPDFQTRSRTGSGLNATAAACFCHLYSSH